MSSKVVVTGASGHIGFHVASVLLDKGYEVHLPLRRETPLTDRLRARGATVRTLDFNDDAALRGVLTGAAGLFHLAAQNTTSQATGSEVAASTLGLTERVITAALETGVPTVVYTSSVVVLGRSPDPDKLINEDDLTASAESPYVQGKSDAEKFVRATDRGGRGHPRALPVVGRRAGRSEMHAAAQVDPRLRDEGPGVRVRGRHLHRARPGRGRRARRRV